MADVEVERQFEVGDLFTVSGGYFRVTQGRKCAEDRVLELYSSIEGRYIKVGFDLLGMLYAFLYENEEVLYPRQDGYKGGGKVSEHCRIAQRQGWEHAAQVVAAERRAKELWTWPQ